MSNLRTYTELIRLPTFEERFDYLKIGARVGDETFGSERLLNQRFYKRSKEWKDLRNHIIARDLGRDLALEGFDINGDTIVIHHMNPITSDDILGTSDLLLNPEFLITTIHRTHNAIHYSDDSIVKGYQLITRTRNDTCPWKRS